MSYTREQNIELIKDYIPTGDMKPLAVLIDEAIASVNILPAKRMLLSHKIPWHNLPDEILEELSYLCAKAGHDFYKKYA